MPQQAYRVPATPIPGKPPAPPRTRRYRFFIPGFGLLGFRRDPQTGQLGCALGCLISALLAAVLALGGYLLSQHQPPPPPPTANLSVRGSVVPGGSMQLHGSNFPSDSIVEITVDGLLSTSSSIGVPASIGNIFTQERPTHLSQYTVTAQSDGTFDTVIPVPSSWEPGSHHIIRATAENGQGSVQASVDVEIQFPSPTSVAPHTATPTVPHTATPTAKSTAPHTATPIPAPAVSGIDPTSGPASGGTNITLSGTYFTNATSVLFGSYTASTFTVVSDTQITVTSPPANSSGTVDVTVTTFGGTSATNSADQFIYIPVISSISPTSGPTNGGTAVTITGSGFTGTTSVSFGSYTASTFTVVSDTQITVTSPPANSSGTVDVTVTTPGGTSATSSADQFTYIPLPVISSINPTSEYGLKGGIKVTITGSGFTGATSVLFGSYTASNFTVVSDTQITVTSPQASSSGTVDITVTTPGGTSAISSADQFTYYLPIQ